MYKPEEPFQREGRLVYSLHEDWIRTKRILVNDVQVTVFSRKQTIEKQIEIAEEIKDFLNDKYPVK